MPQYIEMRLWGGGSEEDNFLAAVEWNFIPRTGERVWLDEKMYDVRMVEYRMGEDRDVVVVWLT